MSDEQSFKNTERATMKAVQALISRKQALYAQHPFLKKLEGRASSLEDAQLIAGSLIFFVMGFQDILRLSHEKMENPALKEVARSHALEDKGHELWFLDDLQHLKVTRDIRWVFSSAHESTRDVLYSIMSEIFHASTDGARLAVGLCLEAAAAESFGRMMVFLEKGNIGQELKYFGTLHRDAEQGHDLFHDETQKQLQSLSFTKEEFDEVIGVVDRVFEGMSRLLAQVNAAWEREEEAYSRGV